MKSHGIAPALAVCLAAAATAAVACGYCVEDRIAAVYDHSLAQRVAAGKHQLLVFSWDGPLVRDAVARRKMLELGEATPGVDKGSTRVSLEPAVIAVAFDPARNSVASITAALQKKLDSLKLSIVVLRAAPPA